MRTTVLAGVTWPAVAPIGIVAVTAFELDAAP